MLNGKTKEWAGKNWCIRAKMNMKDKFKCLRDPVFFRMKMDIPHHKTGTKYKAYPTYDFACPVVDSIEGVTHALRSSEYVDRENGYHWVQKVLGLRGSDISTFSRLNFVRTCLSKRKLKWIIEQGYVDGWEDPRFPTVQGIMRHGLTSMALTKFMLENGASRKTVNMEWDKIWAVNKDVIDPVAPRYTAIGQKTKAEVTLTNGPAAAYFETHPLHPKDASVGTKTIEYGKKIWVETEDAKDLAVGEKVTLMKWGNAVIKSKNEKKGALTLTAELTPEDKDFKKTKKLTWIAQSNTNFEVTVQELDHIIMKEKVEDNDQDAAKDDKIEDILNKNSSIEYSVIAEGNLRTLKKGAKIQLERRGYFVVDNVEIPGDNGKKMKLIFIPDGKQKNMSNISSAID
jgi:glutamyl-tRNA synthetase